jgi:hypothetical protein
LIWMPKENGASICTIITDDDLNGQSKSRHIHNGGVLPLNLEEPDPWHRKRFLPEQYIISVTYP